MMAKRMRRMITSGECRATLLERRVEGGVHLRIFRVALTAHHRTGQFLAGLRVELEIEVITSLPSSCLVMPLSSKLCFVSVDHARGLQSDGDAGKQRFQDKCVTKLEFGHEGSFRSGNNR